MTIRGFGSVPLAVLPSPDRNQHKTVPYIEYTNPNILGTPVPDPNGMMLTPTPVERSESPSPIRRSSVRTIRENNNIPIRQPDFNATQEQESAAQKGDEQEGEGQEGEAYSDA